MTTKEETVTETAEDKTTYKYANVKIEADVYKRLRHVALDADVSLADLLGKAVETYVKELGL